MLVSFILKNHFTTKLTKKKQRFTACYAHKNTHRNGKREEPGSALLSFVDFVVEQPNLSSRIA
jgi:hypothetical protein